VELLITAGPTREFIDPVRFISNGSSGQLGCALAEAALERGHRVHLVLGPVSIAPPRKALTRHVISAEEMRRECLRVFPDCRAAIMTAAVADWRPAKRSPLKTPKSAGNLTLELEPTPDICAELGARKLHQVLMGFALQDEDAHARAEEKLIRKNCDFIVLTSPAAIGSDTARVQVKPRNGPWHEPIESSKRVIAARLLDLVEAAVGGQAG
jgi:phosphopantothenoylcysteine decarboxylase/phosphopantothenate--cysteine ligase